MSGLTKVLSYLGAVAVALGLAFYAGMAQEARSREASAMQVELAQTKTTIADVVDQVKTNAAQGVEHRAAVEQIRTVTKTVIQQVPIYVPKADPDCRALPVGWSLLVNAAATGATLATGARLEPDGAGSAAAASP